VGYFVTPRRNSIVYILTAYIYFARMTLAGVSATSRRQCGFLP